MKLFPLSILILLLTGFSRGYCQETFQIESRDLVLKLEKRRESGFEGIRLVSLREKKTDRVLTTPSSPPLFTLTYCSAGKYNERKAAHADTIAWNNIAYKSQGGANIFSFNGFGTADLAKKLTVEMRISADSDKDGIEISYSALAGSTQTSIVAMTIGRFAFNDFGAKTKMFLPLGSGIIVDNPVGQGPRKWKHGYPGYSVPMPWLVLWNEETDSNGLRSTNNSGIYLGIHDKDGSRKEIECAVNKAINFQFTVQAENMYEGGNDFSIGGKAVLQTITNDWYDGALIYKEWVRKEATWFPKDKLGKNGRTDSPQWIKEHNLWAMHRVSPEEMVPVMKRFQKAFNIPAAVHWYYWHKNPYDNDYPHFFPREGFKEAVQDLQKNKDIFVMPYINGLLWDSKDRGLDDWLYTKEALAGTSKGVDGKPWLYSYGSKESDGSSVKLAHMCPTTNVWQQKVMENILRLARENGTKAVYIDQVAAAIPELCFDKSHGHPLGGGKWWNAGYRTMLENTHTELSKAGLNDVALTTECTGETSLSIVDGFLTWHHQMENQVPAFAAVYGGTIQMIGRDYRAGKTYAERTEPRMMKTNEALACRMKAAEALCFGEQIGWFVPTIIEEKDKFPFLKDIVHLRNNFRHYFYRGEMGRVPDLTSSVPKVTADWNFYDSPLITASAIRTGCWKIKGDKKTESVVVFFANTASEDITSSVRLAFSELGIENLKKTSIFLVKPDGTRKKITTAQLNKVVKFPKESVFAWEIINQ